MARILAIADLHSGAYSSIIPPSSPFSQMETSTKLGTVQRELWSLVENMPEEHKNPDVLFYLGDGIDGKSRKNGGRELYTTDRHKQVDIANAVLNELADFNHTKFFGVRGTPYHTGDEEDFEDLIASECNGVMENSLFCNVNDVMFHLQHKASSSNYEHLRPSAIARERYFLSLQTEANNYPKAQVVLRGHTHYVIGAYGVGWECASLPAFSATGMNDYGTRQCKGVVHFGYTIIDVEDGQWDMKHFITPLESTLPELYSFTI
jgi:predicted phosphodiesterase